MISMAILEAIDRCQQADGSHGRYKEPKAEGAIEQAEEWGFTAAALIFVPGGSINKGHVALSHGMLEADDPGIRYFRH